MRQSTELRGCRLKNPLRGIPQGQLAEDVTRFVEENHLTEHMELFQKGALVAQSPDSVDSVPGLDEADRRVLHEEKTRRWHHPKVLYYTIVMNSIAAAIQGWDQTGKSVLEIEQAHR